MFPSTNFSTCLATLIACLLQLASATSDVFASSLEYNAGEYGSYVTQAFRSSPVVAARPNFMIPYNKCNDGSKLLVALRGWKVGQVAYEAAMMYDTNGDFIWAPEEQYGDTYNFQVADFRGEPHIFFWAGNDRVKGHGEGHYYVLNKHYEHVKTISAGNNLFADLHTFSVTENSTAVSSIYHQTTVDLTVLDPRYSSEDVYDGAFQEIDLETDEILFEWRATEHINFTESYNTIHDTNKEKPWNSTDQPWDFFHINMIEKDDEGNYLVSARHLRSILYIDGTDGHVIWRLGGKSSSFKDLSGGKATDFIGQHDAHWVDVKNRTAITLFDNGRDWQTGPKRASRGMRLNVDQQAMTVSLDLIIEHPFASIESESQGSYQTLPNGNIVLGYGYNAVMSEFSSEGKLVCDAWWQPQADFGSGKVQSYRNLKFPWVGLPKTSPNMIMYDNHLYVSWLGATEVKQWGIFHSSAVDGRFEHLLTFDKSGFETQLALPSNSTVGQFVRAVAHDATGARLGVSTTVDISGMEMGPDGQVVKAQLSATAAYTGSLIVIPYLATPLVKAGFVVIVIVGLALVARLALAVYRIFMRARSMHGWRSVPLAEEEMEEAKSERTT